MKNRLLVDHILGAIEGSILAKNVVYQEIMDSTNNMAKELAAQGASDATLLVAEEQTAGRGRLGRQWLSPRYTNLLFSLLLWPTLPADQVFALTMILAMAAAEAVEQVASLKPLIKWPNDLYVNGKKLAGVLTEFSVKEEKVGYVILGMGLNVNWRPEGSQEIANPATSILVETGREVSRTQLLIEILKHFEVFYEEAVHNGWERLYWMWNERSLVLGRNVEVGSGEGKIFGKACRVDHDGALIILNGHGEEQRVLCGDVSLRFDV